MDFLFQYTKTKTDWPYKQIKPLNPVLIKDQLNIAAYKYGNKKYKKVADQMISESTEFNYWDLVNFKQISK